MSVSNKCSPSDMTNDSDWRISVKNNRQIKPIYSAITSVVVNQHRRTVASSDSETMLVEMIYILGCLVKEKA